MGHLPQPVRKRFSRFRGLVGSARNFFQPLKIMRTTLYHSGLYRISKSKFNGLHIGSGGLKINDFLNFDADVFINCDVVAKSDRINLGNNAVGTIYASHLFEHIPRARTAEVVAEWYRVLKPGGKLYLCVPDLEVLARLYLDNLKNYETENAKYLVDMASNIIYGGQTDKYDFHYYGYSFVTIKSLLTSLGFSAVELFDRKDLTFAPLHDGGFAQVQGISVSLNVVATK